MMVLVSIRWGTVSGGGRIVAPRVGGGEGSNESGVVLPQTISAAHW